MEDENQKSHIKDIPSLPVLYNGQSIYPEFWNRANKLVTALYMVTDIMDTSEPLRIKLRDLGGDILSDMYRNSTQIEVKIAGVLSFLNIASAVGMISEMNWSILMKEFNILSEGIKKSKNSLFSITNGKLSLEDFLRKEEAPMAENLSSHPSYNIGQIKRTRVGVQSGGTLMKVLSNKISDISIGHNSIGQNFDILRKERRQEILDILQGQKTKNLTGDNGLNITEIKSMARGVLVSCGDKTLQRELVSMVKNGLLSRTGDKRWSRYSIL